MQFTAPGEIKFERSITVFGFGLISETTLRLLSLGADPNYLHPEKGTAPLHVAAKAGQILQIEVLVVYGSDPGGSDVNGDSVVDYARNAGSHSQNLKQPPKITTKNNHKK